MVLAEAIFHGRLHLGLPMLEEEGLQVAMDQLAVEHLCLVGPRARATAACKILLTGVGVDPVRQGLPF